SWLYSNTLQKRARRTNLIPLRLLRRMRTVKGLDFAILCKPYAGAAAFDQIATGRYQQALDRGPFHSARNRVFEDEGERFLMLAVHASNVGWTDGARKRNMLAI